MSNNVTIPSARFYVTCNDKFSVAMSGPARGKMHRVIIPCNSVQDVKRLVGLLERNGQFANVRVAGNKPKLSHNNVYSVRSAQALFFYGRAL